MPGQKTKIFSKTRLAPAIQGSISPHPHSPSSLTQPLFHHPPSESFSASWDGEVNAHWHLVEKSVSLPVASPSNLAAHGEENAYCIWLSPSGLSFSDRYGSPDRFLWPEPKVASPSCSRTVTSPDNDRHSPMMWPNPVPKRQLGTGGSHTG
jgi:hypothetical protein